MQINKEESKHYEALDAVRYLHYRCFLFICNIDKY